ncbi:MAG: hypothetical protein EOP45_19285, partial [Sphingobacteriaceae bacterium]
MINFFQAQGDGYDTVIYVANDCYNSSARDAYTACTRSKSHLTLITNQETWNEQLSLHDDGEFFCRVVLASSQVQFCEQARSYYRKGLADSLSSGRSVRAVRSQGFLAGML